MGCGSSSNTVQPMRPEEVKREEDETGSKPDRCGDSAVSKVTTDSGVVMDSRDVPDLPGVLPRKLPPLKVCVRESVANTDTQNDSVQQEITVQERQNSSDILEELLQQGIIPAGPNRERGREAGEAYSIMLGDREGAMRRPPARLESLKAKKAQNLPSREEIQEKMRLADERRKLKEDELKMRLRSKSARVRGCVPTSSTASRDEDTSFTPVETLQSPLTPDAPIQPPHSQIPREAAEGGEWVREAAGDGRESEQEGEGRGDTGDRKRVVSGEEMTQVEELKKDELLTASPDLEYDSGFQRVDEVF